MEIYAPGGEAPLASGCTLGDGTYSIAVVAGTYEVKFSGKAGPCGAQSTFAPEWWDSHGPRAFADPVTVFDSGQRPPDINATLEDGGRVSGTVTDAITALPVANVTVEILDIAGAAALTTCSAPDGTYVLDPLVGGVYSVRFSPSGLCGNAGNYAVQWFDGASTQASASAINMAPSVEIANVDAKLTAPAPVVDPPGGDPPGGDPPGSDPPGADPPGTNPPAGAPNTTLDSAKVKAKKGKATFAFSGSGGNGALRFECALTKGKATPSFATCSSPQTYKRLKKGRYTFAVRAVDAAGSVDPSPATQPVKSKRKRR